MRRLVILQLLILGTQFLNPGKDPVYQFQSTHSHTKPVHFQGSFRSGAENHWEMLSISTISGEENYSETAVNFCS